MAIAKWIPFGAHPVASENVKPQQVAVISSADAKKFGLENFGNTCYANSVIQALYFCGPFRELIIQSVDNSVPQDITEPPTPVIPPTNPSGIATTRRKPERKHSSSGHPLEPSHASGFGHSAFPPIPSAPPTLFSALRSLFLHISKNPADKGSVAPRAFIDKLKEANELFRSTMHQDAHEFLNYLLNKIVEEIEEQKKSAPGVAPSGEDLSSSITSFASRPAPTVLTSNSGTAPQDATLVHKLFEGVLTSETRCLTCETVSSRDESFLDLSIDIEQNSSVTACLRQFSASEMLCQKNKFFCDACCDLQEAEKRMKIKKLPNVLALHLKRFKYQEDVQKYIKLAYRVAFPFELRLFNTVDDTDDADRLYELFAIVVHIGSGPHHGHYVSIIKTLGTWFVFDDDQVDAIKESEIPKYFGESNSGSAYVLYYQAVNIDLAALGLRSPSPVPEVVEQPLPQPANPPASPSQLAPALPPGLEVGSSDISDPSLPVTPASHPSLLPVYPEKVKAPRKVPSQPLKVNVGMSEGTASVAHSPTVSAPGASASSSRGGLLHSIRRAPSGKNGDGSSVSTDSASNTENSFRTSKTHTSDKPDVIPPLPVAPTIKGKEKATKDPERKPSTWFKRKSVREKTRTLEQPPSPGLPPSESESGHHSTAWFRTSGYAHKAKDKSIWRSSDHDESEAPPSNHLLPQSSSRRDLLDRGRSESPSAGSASSSLGSTSTLPPAAFPPTSQLDSIPGSPISPTAEQWLPSFASPPERPTRHPERQSSFAQNRPRTGVDVDLSSATRRRPLPRVPSPARPLTSPQKTVSVALPNGHASEDQRDPSENIDTPEEEQADAATHPVHMNGGPPMVSFVNSLSTGSNSSETKKTGRKLSLTAPMLGFGKKDKDKSKDKDKEKARKAPPTYPQFSLASRI